MKVLLTFLLAFCIAHMSFDAQNSASFISRAQAMTKTNKSFISHSLAQAILIAAKTLQKSSKRRDQVLRGLSEKMIELELSCHKDKKEELVNISNDTKNKIKSIEKENSQNKKSLSKRELKASLLNQISVCRATLFKSLPFSKRYSNTAIVRDICQKAASATQCLKDMNKRAKKEEQLQHEELCYTDPEYLEVNYDTCENPEDAAIMSEN